MTVSTPREPRGIPASGSAFIRSFAALTGAATADASQPAFAERLSRWLAWTDAIELSSVLSPPLAGALPVPTGDHLRRLSLEEGECRRVRESLLKSIQAALADAAAAPLSLRRSAGAAAALPADDPWGDFAPHRLRYQTRQQAMEAAIGPLRRRLRQALASTSPQLEKLATLDAVMEQAVAPRERALLSRVPAALEQRFKHLQSQPGPLTNAEAPPAWLLQFCKELQDMLLTELELRLQPIEGLLDALRSVRTEVSLHDE